MKTKFSLKLMFFILTLLVVDNMSAQRPTFWTYNCSTAPTWDTQGVYTGGSISFLDGKMELTCTGATFYPRIQFGTVMNTWYPIDLSLPANSFAKFRIKCTAGVPVKLVCEPRKTTASAGMTQTISINNTGVWQNVLFNFPFISGTSNYLTGFTFKVTNASGGFVAFSASIDEIVFGTDLSTDYFRSKTSGSWSDVNTWESSSDNSVWMNAHLSPAASATSIGIMTGHEVSVLANANASSLSINSGAKLTLNDTYTLSANSFNINSDVSNGTGTFVDGNATGGLTVNGITTVNQYLGTTRNWYISSPVSNAKVPAGYTYYQRDEANANWTSIPFVATNTFNPGTGYIALPDATNATLTFSTETGGSINTGNVPVSLTWSGATSKGFNLIGNPYPSNLTWTKAFVDDVTNAALIEPTIYYRTNTGSVNSGGDAAWSFKTYNSSTDEFSPAGTTNIIPPMQAFWVRAKAAGALILDNKLIRSHQTSNPLKAPAAKNTDRQRVRLEVLNGISTDEALIYFDANASDNFDSYDSPKFTEASSVLQIFTTVGNEKLVINGMNNIPLDTPIGLGFVAGHATSFSIRANEITNIPAGVKVILKDNVTLTETDLTDGISTYQFSPIVTSSNRFSVIFRTSSVTTAINKTIDNSNPVFVFKNANNQIAVNISSEIVGKVSVSVYNAVGQKLENKLLTSAVSILNNSYTSGVYLVNVNANGKTITHKVVVN